MNGYVKTFKVEDKINKLMSFCIVIMEIKIKTIPKTLKYWVGVQQGQSYLMGRRYLLSLG